MARTLGRLALLAILAAPVTAPAEPPVEDAVPVRVIELGAGDALGLRAFRHVHRRGAELRAPAPPAAPLDPEAWLREWRLRRSRDTDR